MRLVGQNCGGIQPVCWMLAVTGTRASSTLIGDED